MTKTGLEYAGLEVGSTRVRIPWSLFARIDIRETRTPRGQQHSAFGIGPIGVAIVAATAIANVRARKIDVRCFVKVTVIDGRTFHFTPAQPTDDVLQPVWGLIHFIEARNAERVKRENALKLERETALQLQQTAAEKPAEPQIFIADELQKLGALRDSGLLTDEEFAQQKSKLLNS